MQSVGLMPSSTGMVGGKITGAKMGHYILDDGPFAKAFAELAAADWKLNLESTIYLGAARRRDSSKVKFTCPKCAVNAWGKPDLLIACIPCGVQMMSAQLQRVADQTREAA